MEEVAIALVDRIVRIDRIVRDIDDGDYYYTDVFLFMIIIIISITHRERKSSNRDPLAMHSITIPTYCRWGVWMSS